MSEEKTIFKCNYECVQRLVHYKGLKNDFYVLSVCVSFFVQHLASAAPGLEWASARIDAKNRIQGASFLISVGSLVGF